MRIILILHLLAVAIPVAAQSVDQLRKSFDEHRERTAAVRDGQLEKLSESYLGGLQRLLDKTKASGKLDTVLPVHEEIEAVKHGDAELSPLPEAAMPELKQMRAKFQDGRHQILKTHATALDALAAKMESALRAREADLTKTGKIDEAVAARESLADMAKDKDLLAARDLLKLGGSTANGKPALQLRRYGDNLEVLVYYDRKGKVSMDSPVENTRERTGEGKELGDTKAMVLGEFVGAKGYEVDPYVAYDHSFGGNDIGGMSFGGLESTPAFKVEDEKGIRISFADQKVDTYFAAIRDVLPPKSIGGTVRISARYHVPKSNRAVNGIRFEASSGTPIGLPLVSSGKWGATTVVGECDHELPSLIIKLNLRDRMTRKEARDDFVVVGALKVEHIRFSAFVQNRFGNSQGGSEAESAIDRQPLLIANGGFAE